MKALGNLGGADDQRKLPQCSEGWNFQLGVQRIHVGVGYAHTCTHTLHWVQEPKSCVAENEVFMIGTVVTILGYSYRQANRMTQVQILKAGAKYFQSELQSWHRLRIGCSYKCVGKIIIIFK